MTSVAQGQITRTDAAAAPKVSATGTGTVRVEVDGYSIWAEPGRPQLPRNVVTLALPPDARPETVRVVVDSTSSSDLSLAGKVAAGEPRRVVSNTNVVDFGAAVSIVDGRDTSIYGSTALYPASPVEILETSSLRDWKLVRLAISPVQYAPAANLLRVHTRISYTVTFERTVAPPAIAMDGAMDKEALKLIANGAQAASWYRGIAAAPSTAAGTTYCILTTDAILSSSPTLYGLVTHKQAMGYTVRVVTETGVDGNAALTGWNEVTGQAPNEKADKMRQWLKSNYSALQIKYVLLVGNPTPNTGDLPMKMCWPMRTSDYPDCPTDYYYADLTGNWDKDGDLYYGEETGDGGTGGVDFTADVYVGRIPVYPSTGWQTNLSKIVRKIINYETAVSPTWRKRALLPMSYLDVNTDEGILGEAMRTNFLAAKSYATWTQYEQGSCSTQYDSRCVSNEELKERSVVNYWKSNTVGAVMWMGHGWSQGAALCGASIFRSDLSPELRDAYPSLVFMGSCSCGYPEDENNLAYSCLRNGAILSLGATRVSWYAGLWLPHMSHPDIGGVGYHILREAISNDATFGEAVYRTMATMAGGASGGWWMNRMDFNLYGDPSLKLTSSQPDADGDGMSDAWETQNAFDPNNAFDAALDADGDGLTNRQEHDGGTNARSDDTDYDGILDGADNNPTLPAYAQVTLTPARLGHIEHGYMGSLTCVTGSVRIGYEPYSHGGWYNHGYVSFNPSAIPARSAIKNVALIYTGTQSSAWQEWGTQAKITPLGDLNPEAAGAVGDVFRAITNHPGLQVVSTSVFPRLVVAENVFRMNGAVASNLASRLSSGVWSLGFSTTTGYPSFFYDLSSVRAVVSYEALRSSYQSMTLAGTFNGWNQALNNMQLVADYTWQTDLTVTNLGGVRFKFVANASWSTNWGEQNQTDFDPPMDALAERGNHPDILVNGTLNGTYRFTLNEQTGAYTLRLLPPPDSDSDGMPDAWEQANGLDPYNAADASGNPDNDLFTNLQEYQNGTNPRVWNRPNSTYSAMTAAGTFNGWNAALTNMTLVNHYTWQFETTLVRATGVRFKFVANGSWAINWGEQNQSDLDLPISGNAERGDFADIVLNGTVDGTVRFTFNEQTAAYTVSVLPPPDADNDGMPDAWEVLYRLNPNSAADAALDADADGVLNGQEYVKGTNPLRGDTDFDTVGDNIDTTPLTPNYDQVRIPADRVGAISGSISGSGGTWQAGQILWGVNQWNRYSGIVGFNLSIIPDRARIRNVALLYSGEGNGWGYATKVVNLGTLDPVTQGSAVDAYITSNTGVQTVTNEFPRFSGLDGALVFKTNMTSQVAIRLPYDRITLGLGYVHQGQTAILEITNTTLVVTYSSMNSAYTSIGVAGTFNGWNFAAGSMEQVADYTWQWESVVSNAVNPRFKFVANGSWAINWGEQNQTDVTLPLDGTAERGDFGDITVSGTMHGRYRFTFNEQTGIYRVEEIVIDADADGMSDDWERLNGLNPASALDAGEDPDLDGFTNLQEYRNQTNPRSWDRMNSDYSSMSVPGTYNGWSLSAYKMRLVDHYTWSIDLNFFSSGTIELKFAANEAWGINWGDNNQGDLDAPLAQIAERTGGNIRLNGPFSGYFRLTFNERTGAYSFGLRP